MSDLRNQALEYAHQNSAAYLQSLQSLVQIPSISTSVDHKKAIKETAEWLADRLRKIGFKNVALYPTAGHPVVFGEYIIDRPGRKTVLIYGHYDVQPVEPLEQWKTNPFEATVVGDNLFGRGASDMKGQIMASMDAVEAVIHAGEPPVNIKFMIEGEEEIGSPNLGPFLKEKAKLLAADVVLNPDSGMLAADFPTLTYALRGLAYFELRVYGPEHDLHSGLFGGAVHNPAQALAELIAGMHDADGRVTLPGYYDSVREMKPAEREDMARLPLNDDFYKAQTGAPELCGEKGYTAAERIGARPTLEVNGLLSGFTGQGSKTVIPAWAMAKISMRLVPDQDPEEVYHQFIEYLKLKAPPTIRWEVIRMSGGPASFTDPNHPAARAMSQAMETVWGKRPVFRREGGSIPIVSDMQETLGIESVLTGFGLPEDNVHAPNEKLHLPTWYRGIDSLILFFYNYGAQE
ncbi:acetylornithine deacetylase/Succinyl-diaminopimelate desuccinylase [Longilinea arvoryzae]|uniref:Acetylornithine deacetylase/Succinyl-diaminopimelate desuccinylase n=1 Tax=Longilinea arvoryzae TaxID=360412 RepID=A0A0S7BK53_9CHLR|nr:dipeptidase [Longilinea arvoryzae]GAP14712.1 acetylornithine deacetylase/Succinyl-diaminopimelate desuccinylase [Longilinea arvoryzae]